MFLHIALSNLYYDLLSTVFGKCVLFLKVEIIIQTFGSLFQTAVFPKDGNFDKLALWYTLPILLITSDSFYDASN